MRVVLANITDAPPPHIKRISSPKSSSSAAKRVMDWFRRKSSSRYSAQPQPAATSGDSLSAPGVLVPSADSFRVKDLSRPAQTTPPASSSIVEPKAPVSNTVVASTTDDIHKSTGYLANDPTLTIFVSLKENNLRYHTGVIDQATLTTRAPAVVMQDVINALKVMRIDFKKEGDATLRCIRPSVTSSEALGKEDGDLTQSSEVTVESVSLG